MKPRQMCYASAGVFAQKSARQVKIKLSLAVFWEMCYNKMKYAGCSMPI